MIVLLALAALCAAGDTADDAAAKRQFERNKRTGQLERWARSGDAALAAKIRPYMKDEDAIVRIAAAVALFRVAPGAAEATTLLVAAMRSKDEEISWAAGRALVRLGKPVVALLQAELRDGPARSIAAAALGSDDADPADLRPVAATIEAAIRTARTRDERHNFLWLATRDRLVARACVKTALAYLHDGYHCNLVLDLMHAAGADPSYVLPLRALIHEETIEFDGKSAGRIEYELAASLLCRCGPSGIEIVIDRLATLKWEQYRLALRMGLNAELELTFEPVLKATRSPRPRVRERVIPTLLEPTDEPRLARSVDALLRLMFRDEDAAVRKEAAWALPQAVRTLGSTPQRAALRKAVAEHPDGYVRDAAFHALAMHELLDVAFLEPRLNDSSKGVRVSATWHLGRHGAKAARCAPAILARLAAGDPPMPCIYSLAAIAPGEARVIDAIAARLDAENPTTATAAARALATIGPRAARAQAKLRKPVKGPRRREWLWRRYALWKVSGKADDQRALLADLERSVRGFKQLDFWDRAHVGEMLVLLGPEAADLLPAIDEVLRTGDLGPTERRPLAEARRKLRR